MFLIMLIGVLKYFSVHLIRNAHEGKKRNAHEEGPKFLDVKPAGAQKGGGHCQSILMTGIPFLKDFSLEQKEKFLDSRVPTGTAQYLKKSDQRPKEYSQKGQSL